MGGWNDVWSLSSNEGRATVAESLQTLFKETSLLGARLIRVGLEAEHYCDSAELEELYASALPEVPAWASFCDFYDTLSPLSYWRQTHSGWWEWESTDNYHRHWDKCYQELVLETALQISSEF